MNTRLRKFMMACLVGMGAMLVLMQPGDSALAESRTTPVVAQREANTLGDSQWLPMVNEGLNGVVFTVAALGSDLYVGGKFTATRDGAVQGLNSIAKFSNGTWSALPNEGLDGVYVRDIEVLGNDLYVAGIFSETADGAVGDLNNVAKFSNGQWEALPNKGLRGQVNDLEIHGTDIYAGGIFGYTGDYALVLNNIAKLSNGVWSQLPNKGLNHEVRSIKWFKNDLYAGGFFTGTKDSENMRIKHFAKLRDGTEWEAVSGDGLNDDVTAMALHNNRLVLGGRFTESADGFNKNLNRIVTWNGTGYGRFPNDGLSNRVESLMVYDGILFVGGAFIRTMDDKVRDLNYVAMFRNNVWFPLPNKGMSSVVYTTGVIGGSLVVGGAFDGTYDRVLTDSWNIAEMNLGANLKVRQSMRNGNTPTEFIASINVTNRGPNPASEVKMVNKEPAGYNAINATTNVGTCDVKERKVVCILGTLTNNQSVDISVTFRSESGTPVVVNCAEATSTTFDLNPQNQKACSRIPPN